MMILERLYFHMVAFPDEKICEYTCTCEYKSMVMSFKTSEAIKIYSEMQSWENVHSWLSSMLFLKSVL